MTDEKQDTCLLEVRNLSKAFKALLALDNYCLELRAGEILGVIGPNGAGKTTLINIITGFLVPTHGSVVFAGQNITGLRPDLIAKLSIVRTFQNIRLFGTLSALENVKAALELRDEKNFLATLLTSGSFVEKERSLEERALAQLKTFGLEKYRDVQARALPYGDQRRLEMARALSTGPRLLLLDEPTAGMGLRESDELLRLIRNIRDTFQLTIILVAHDMRLVMQLCERIQVLSYGQIIAEGEPEHVRTNPLVLEAYLGRARSYA